MLATVALETGDCVQSDIPCMSSHGLQTTLLLPGKSAESFSEMTSGLWDDNGQPGWNL